MKNEVHLPPPAVPKVEVPLDLLSASKVIELQKGKNDDDILDAMSRAAGLLTEAANHTKTANAAIMGNQMKSATENLIAARRRVRQIHDLANSKVADLRDRVERKIAALEAGIQPASPRDAMQAIYAQEIRSTIAKLKPEDRVRACRDSIEQGDEAFIGAVVSGSPLLTGMTPTELKVVLDMWQRRHHGETVERTARLRTAQAQLDRLSGLFTNWSGGIYREREESIARAERSAEAASAAVDSGG